MLKKGIVIISLSVFSTLSLNAHAVKITFNFLLGTAFLAKICQVDLQTHYSGTRNCSGFLGVGSSHIIERNINEHFCISVMRWPIVIPVLDEYYFTMAKEEDSVVELWGASINPKFSYPDSNVSMYGTRVINAPRDYCTSIP